MVQEACLELPDSDDFLFHNYTPTDPLEVKSLMDDESPNLVDESAPLTTSVILYEINKEKAEGLECNITFGNQTFRSNGRYIEPDTLGGGMLIFDNWVGLQKDEGAEPIFPQDLDVINEVSFLIKEPAE